MTMLRKFLLALCVLAFANPALATWDPLNRSLFVGLSGGNLTTKGVVPLTVGVAVDVTNKLIWFRNGYSTKWNNSTSADPAAGSGGFTFTPSSGLFPMVSCDPQSPGNITITGTFATASMAFTIPSGFSSWDTATSATNTWNPSDKNASIALSGGNLIATCNSTATYIAVRATNSLSSGKAYYEYTMTGVDGNNFSVDGIGTSGAALNNYVGSTASVSVGMHNTGTIFGATGTGETISYTTANNIPATGLGQTSHTNTGKWYFEVALTTVTGTGGPNIGLSDNNIVVYSASPGASTHGYSYAVASGVFSFNGSTLHNGDTYGSGDTMGVAVDLANQLIWFYCNHSGTNRWNAAAIGSQNPATGTGGWSISSVPATVWPFITIFERNSTGVYTAAFTGATTFTVPAGFTLWENQPASGKGNLLTLGAGG